MTTTTSEAPDLATGWDASTPDDDHLLRRFLVHFHTINSLVAGASGGIVHRDGAIAVADPGRPSGYFTSAIPMRPPDGPDGWDAVLDHLAGLTDGAEGEQLLWSPFPTPDLSDRGWHRYGHPPILVRPPSAANVPERRLEVSVERVRDAADLARWERAAVLGYPMPDLYDATPGSMVPPAVLDDPRFAAWIGHHDGEAVSVGTAVVAEDLLGFALGATRSDVRGRGHWFAHAAARLRWRPDLWAAGIFSDHSRPLAEAIGFVPLTRLTLWGRHR